MELIRVDVPPDSCDTPSKIVLTPTLDRSDAQIDEKSNLYSDKTLPVKSEREKTYTLGRGPLLQITDSKVSRKHALIAYDNSQDSWRMTAFRDCYYCPQAKSEVSENVNVKSLEFRCLKKDDKIDLETGYIIALLPDGKYAYKIVMNEDIFNQQVKRTEKLEASNICEKNSNQLEAPENKDIEGNVHDLLKNHANSSSIDTIKSPGKSRVLPAWMLNLSKTKGEPEKNSNNTSSHKAKKDDMYVARADVPHNEETWYEKAFAVANSTESVSSQLVNDTKVNDTPEYTQNVEIKSTFETASKPLPSVRPNCSFGASCYRKNPQHKLDEAHPGDDDYKEEHANENLEKDESPVSSTIDNRPECEYGTHCYRKNIQHKKDFKHNSRPRKAKRIAAKRAQKNAKRARGEHLSGESDSYESDFIDDMDSEGEDISSDEEDIDEWKPEDDDIH